MSTERRTCAETVAKHMQKYISIMTGIAALSIEMLVFLALMEIPPFRKGDSDIIWGVPCFGLIVVGLAISGLVIAMNQNKTWGRADRLILSGLILNGLALAIPILLLLLTVLRAFLSQ